MIRLALVALLSLCVPVAKAAEPEPRPLVPVYLIDDDDQAMDLLASAGLVLGVDFELVDYWHGALVIDLINLADGEQVVGTALTHDGCSRSLWASRSDPLILAHEIGHLLGLPHVPDPANLMYPYAAGGYELEPWQHYVMARTLEGLRSCPRID
jgi:hypothetical protein